MEIVIYVYQMAPEVIASYSDSVRDFLSFRPNEEFNITRDKLYVTAEKLLANALVALSI